MAPGMRIIKKKIGDEEGRMVRTPEWQLLEGTPADEEPSGSDLDRGEVSLHGAMLWPHLRWPDAGDCRIRDTSLFRRPISISRAGSITDPFHVRHHRLPLRSRQYRPLRRHPSPLATANRALVGSRPRRPRSRLRDRHWRSGDRLRANR